MPCTVLASQGTAFSFLFKVKENSTTYPPPAPITAMHTPMGRDTSTSLFPLAATPSAIPRDSWLAPALYSLPRQLLVSLFLHSRLPSLLCWLTDLTETFSTFLVVSSFGGAQLQMTREQKCPQSPQAHHEAAPYVKLTLLLLLFSALRLQRAEPTASRRCWPRAWSACTCYSHRVTCHRRWLQGTATVRSAEYGKKNKKKTQKGKKHCHFHHPQAAI